MPPFSDEKTSLVVSTSLMSLWLVTDQNAPFDAVSQVMHRRFFAQARKPWLPGVIAEKLRSAYIDFLERYGVDVAIYCRVHYCPCWKFRVAESESSTRRPVY